VRKSLSISERLGVGNFFNKLKPNRWKMMFPKNMKCAKAKGKRESENHNG